VWTSLVSINQDEDVMLCMCRSTKVVLVDLVVLIFSMTLNSKERQRYSNFDDWRNCCGTTLVYILEI
jgi:hypothetical protein